jgi:WD40 repeat protein
LIYHILLSSGVCSPPIVKNLLGGQETRLISAGSHRASSESVDEPISAATYDRRGQYIITGSAKGQITVYDAKTLKPIVHCRQQGNQQQVREVTVTNKSTSKLN